MQKFFILILAASIACSLCACAIGSDLSSTNGSGQNAGSTNDTNVQTNVVLIENDTMTATFVGSQDESSLGAFYVTLKVDNKTDTEIVITLEDADVDGESIPLITTGVPMVIRPGNSGQTNFIFSMVNLSISSMSEAEKATFRVVARNSNTYETIYESELITVRLH